MKIVLKLGLALGLTMAFAFIGCKHETVEPEPVTYTVGISTDITNGTVTANKQTAQKDETVTLTLAANEGYEFDSISVKDASNNNVVATAVTSGTTYTFVMPESNVTVSATFTPMSYTVAISTDITNGTLTANKQTAQKDETVTLTLAANEGYEFDSISVKDASNNTIETTAVTSGTTYTFVMPAKDVNVSATFIPMSYAIDISTDITNGTVTANKQTAQKDENVTLTLEASEGYKLDSISVKKAYNNTIYTCWYDFDTARTTYTFVMPECDVTVSATFIWEGIYASSVFIDGRKISIRSTLWASDHEVTQAEYLAVMGTNPSYFTSSPADGEIQENRPVEQVSWYDCLVYCNKRSKNEGLTPCYTVKGSTNPSDWGSVPTSSNSDWDAATCDFDANGYRLPTEAEWEYLARGKNLTNSGQTAYSGSDTVGDVAWYLDNSGNKTHEVKKKAPNAIGLYDMSGNVHEWCWDWWEGDNITADTPSVGVSTGNQRINRGGSCRSRYYDCKVAIRFVDYPYYRHYSVGFRVVRSYE